MARLPPLSSPWLSPLSACPRSIATCRYTQRISAILGSNSGSRFSGSSAPPLSRGQALVRLDLVLGQDLAHRSLSQLRQARMPGGRSVLTSVCGEEPGGPQLGGITQLTGL